MDIDRIARLERTIAQFTALVDGLDREDATRPTPCRSWSVGELVDHVIGDVGPFTAAARGEKPDYSAPAPSVEGERASILRAATAELLEQWRRAEAPSGSALDLQLSELTVHGWDLAAALGRTDDLDPTLAVAALDVMQANLAPEFRGSESDGKFFGPMVEQPDSAAPYARLVGFAGRDPAWSA